MTVESRTFLPKDGFQCVIFRSVPSLLSFLYIFLVNTVPSETTLRQLHSLL